MNWTELFLSLLFPECNKAVDVALVIDASGSMSQVTFNIVIQFLKLLVDRFDFPNSGTRSVKWLYGWVQYYAGRLFEWIFYFAEKRAEFSHTGPNNAKIRRNVFSPVFPCPEFTFLVSTEHKTKQRTSSVSFVSSFKQKNRRRRTRFLGRVFLKTKGKAMAKMRENVYHTKASLYVRNQRFFHYHHHHYCVLFFRQLVVLPTINFSLPVTILWFCLKVRSDNVWPWSYYWADVGGFCSVFLARA